MAQIRNVTRHTCGTCAVTWSGLSACHCSVCHRTFRGITLFDRHRVGNKCVNPAIIKDKNGVLLMKLDGAGLWRSTREQLPTLFDD